MSKIKIKLKPANGIKVKTDTTYLFDPTLEQAMIDLSKDWAIKTDGLVEEDGVGVDYSSKAYAIGGDGTETNNAKYYAEQAGISETNAASSASSASASEISASASAGVATSKASEASTSATNAANSASSASSSATSASNNAISAGNSATSAAGSASTASTQAGIATTQAGYASGYATSAANSAAGATTSATNAQTWAEGTDEQVSVLGGEKSSKGWCQRAKELVDSIGTVLHYKGSVATYDDLPTTGREVGDMYNVIDTGNNYVWAGTGWDEISGIVDLSPYRKSADQDTIDSGKVDKVTAVSKVYGTDSTGNQTTYDKDSFGQVDDVKVNGTSVVTNKVASITVPTQPSDIGAATAAQGTKADSALQPNSPITGATKCKITYDSNGLVTAGSDLEANDIPSLTISKISDITATASELNVLDGITASTTELNYLDGVTSSIQTQLNGKQPTGNYMTTDTEQSIDASAKKTFNGRVNFIGVGDANAIYLSTDTRIDVYGTNRTVLGFANGTFLINNAAYPLNLRGSGARPAWNVSSYLALTSDIGNATLTIQKNGTAVDTFNANATSDKTINITVPTSAADVSALPSSTKYGADLSYSSNTLQLKDQDGNNLGSAVTISGGGSVDIDSLSITKNGDDEIQTVGVIDQRDTSTAIKTWTGTKVQYDAIVSKDSDTIYNVKDEPNTFQSLLETIYPVGSIYIGTMAICPMSALFGTWTLIGTKILTDIPSTLEAKGNGTAIGVTDGTDSAGLAGISGYGVVAYYDLYNQTTGTAASGTNLATSKALGLTTDSTKSGIVADTNASSLTVNLWQRSA